MTATAAAMFAEAKEAYEAGNDSAAAQRFYETAVTFPDFSMAPDALYYAGTLFYRLQDYDGSAKALEKYRKLYADGTYLTEVYHWLGLSLFGQARYQDAIAVFADELSMFPEAEYKGDALKYTGMAYELLGEHEKAKESLGKAVEFFRAEGKTETVRYLEEYIASLP